MATPYFSAPIVIVKPTQPGNDSYYDVLFNAVSPLGPTGTVLDGWCIQPFVKLDYNNGYTYSGYGYPSFEVAADNDFTASGAINWLLNYYRSGNSGYTAMDVQNSIWHLVAEDFGDTSGLTQLALSHNDFVPDIGDVMAVVIDPVTAAQIHDQNLIVETKAAKLGDRVWHDADADGIQDAGEAGIAGATVQLVRDANGDGIISGANEILATTTTDANGNYSFKGLTPGLSYQVRFTDPAGYDAASPRQSDGSATSGTNSDGKLSNVIYLAPGEYNATVDSGFYKYAKRSTQIVDVTVHAVSDGPDANGAKYHPSGWEKQYVVGGVTHLVHTYKLSDFGTFSDSADQLQQFGTYNTGVANDADTQQAVVLSGLKAETDGVGNIVYNGQVLDFSQGQTYVIPVADISAGKLELDFQTAYRTYYLAWQMQDSGTVANPYCYEGTILSNTGTTTIQTPIALDLDGDGKIGVTGATSSYDKDANAALGRTVQFDMNGDGAKETTEWFDGSGDGILIDNRDGNAAHDMNGARLFGDQGGAYGNGYYKLTALDTNHDGKLSGGELKGVELWVDNGDAVVQAGEIQTLAQHGIDAIGTQLALTYDAQGKLHIESTATRTDGSTLMSEDVFFAGSIDAAPALSQLLGHDSLDGVLGTVAPTTAVASNDADATADVSDAADVLRKLVAAMNSEQSHATAA